MTRILTLTNMYPPHHYGGYELSCKDVMERFRARGHEVTVLTTTMRVPGVDDPPDERSKGVRRDLIFYWDDHKLVSPSFRRRLAIERANQATLAATLDSERPEVVSAWNMNAMSLGLLTTVIERGIPLVLVLEDEWPIWGLPLDAWSRLFRRSRVLGSVIRRATRVPTNLPDLGSTAVFCCISSFVRERIEERSPWTPKIATVVYIGIEQREFPESHHAVEKRPWRWRLLYVGRLDERKGIHVAVEALTHLPVEATLDVVGGGDPEYESRVRELVERLGLGSRVRFAVSDRAQLHKWYWDADAVVFPPVWSEPFGLVPVEAMSCGTPVVAAATGGSAEYLLDRVNCLRVPSNDPQAIAAAIRELSVDSDLRRKLVTAGRLTAAELGNDQHADLLEEWHLAAAHRFAEGLPEDRPSPVAGLGSSGGTEKD